MDNLTLKRKLENWRRADAQAYQSRLREEQKAREFRDALRAYVSDHSDWAQTDDRHWLAHHLINSLGWTHGDMETAGYLEADKGVADAI